MTKDCSWKLKIESSEYQENMINCFLVVVLTFRTIFVHNMFSWCCELLKKIYLYWNCPTYILLATFEGNFLMFSWAKKTSPRNLCSKMTLLTCSMYSACSSIMYLAYNGDSKERKKGGNNWAVKEATAPRLTIKANVAWKSSLGPSEPWVPRGQYPTTLPRTKTFSLYYYFQVFKPSYGPAS